MAGEKRLITTRDILNTFFKNKVIISIVLLAALGGALIYCAFTSPRYRAETKILIKMGKAQISGMQQFPPEQFNMVFQERSQNIRNEMELLKGEYLTEKVVSRLKDQMNGPGFRKSYYESAKEEVRNFLFRYGIVQKPASTEKNMVGVFLKALGVTYLEDTDMIRLTFDWTDPQIAAMVANAYADEYVTQHTKVYETQRSYRFYIDQIELFEKKLRDAEDELQGFISKSNLANIELQKEILLRNIGDLNNRLNLVMVDAAQARTKLKKVQEMARTPGVWIETPDIGSAMLDKQAYLRTLDDSYFKLKIDRERLLKNYTTAANEVKAIDLQLGNLRSQKAESLTNIVNMELALAENKRTSLQREISEETKKLDSVTAKTLTLKQLQRTRDLVEGNYQIYKKKAEDLRISDDLDARRISSVKIATPAIPPLTPAYPRKGIIIGMAAFLGLFFGFGFAAIREFFDHTFKDEDNVLTNLGVPMLLSVPFSGRRERRSIIDDLVAMGDRMRGRIRTGVPAPVDAHSNMSMRSTSGSWISVLSLSALSLCIYFSVNGSPSDQWNNKPTASERYLAQVVTAPKAGSGHEDPSAGAGIGDSHKTLLEALPSDPAREELTAEAGRSKAAPSAIRSGEEASPSVGRRTEPATQEKKKPVAIEHTVTRGQTLVGVLRDVFSVPDDFIFNEAIERVRAANPGIGANLWVGQKILIPEEVAEKGKTIRKGS
ncbi:MAG TPA: Wzz/FepE/Etk N-terminal domain-containing protein [Syntrophorhabdaceae bacterium]|jgi:uncharacterized protein involved in exopolysaccharide biosynthesis